MFSEYYHNSVPGELPIRALYPLWWQNFLFFRLHYYSAKWIDFNVIYDCSDRTKKKPSIRDTEIHLPETFLSFLWSYSYALAALTPRPNHTITPLASERAYKLLADSKQILNGELYWDKDVYPNPEILLKEEIEFGDIAMTIFLGAMAFVINHEAAHKLLGHFNVIDASKETLKEMEYEADKFAVLNLIPPNKDMDDKKVIQFKLGTITAVCSLIMASSDIDGGPKHPDPDHRIHRVIEHLNLSDDEEQVWGYAWFALMVWGIVNKKPHPLPDRYISVKQAFFDVLDGFDKVKTH